MEGLPGLLVRRSNSQALRALCRSNVLERRIRCVNEQVAADKEAAVTGRINVCTFVSYRRRLFWARGRKRKRVINETKTATQTANKRRPTLAKIFSRELVRELRALFFRISSLNRLPVAAPSAADELFAAFCETTR